jgi:hypothetical protein
MPNPTAHQGEPLYRVATPEEIAQRHDPEARFEVCHVTGTYMVEIPPDGRARQAELDAHRALNGLLPALADLRALAGSTDRLMRMNRQLSAIARQVEALGDPGAAAIAANLRSLAADHAIEAQHAPRTQKRQD